MQCPNCSVEMDEVRKLDVIIDSCSKCGGIWLDKGELEKIRAVEAASQAEPEYREERDRSHSHDDDHGDKHSVKHSDEHGGKHGEGRKKKRGGGFMDILGGFGGD